MYKKKLTVQAKKNQQETRYKVRHEIVEHGRIRCPAFSVPLMDFDAEVSDSEDDDANVDFDHRHPATVKAKKTWKKLFKLILDRRTDIPLKQMALKAKHEKVLLERM